MSIEWVGNSGYMEINGIRWKVAYKLDGEAKLTPDGVLFCPEELAYQKSSSVESAKRRSRKVVVEEEAPSLDDLELDDI